MSVQPRIWDIPGGIHPPQNKSQSTSRGLERVPLPSQLVLPLLQHIGTRAEPVVQVGDRVLKGQLLATAQGQFSCPVHAPTSGTISAISPAPYPHISGLAEPAITLDSDGEDRWTELMPVPDYRDLEPAPLLELIAAAGISGLGGAGFPTASKLLSRPDHQIHTLIINGAECEPYITADDMIMRHYPAQILAGIAVLQHILKSERVLVGIEDNKPEALNAMRDAAQQHADIEIIAIPTKYPSGGEKQLIQILTGQEVPSGGLPADIGVLCQNIGTALAVHDAVLLGKPLISRIVTLTGAALDRPTNVEALIGTRISELLTFAGLQSGRVHRLLLGGPMMGFSVAPDAPIIKTSNCLLAATLAELPPPPPALPCIRCGLCAEACPAELLPQQLHWFAMGKDYAQLERQNLFDCIECGACAYVCPSSIPLVQYFRAGKSEIRTIELQQRRAEQSRQRFEYRQERLQQEAAQRERDRQARAEKAARAKAAREAKAADEQATAAAPAEPDLARVQASKASTLTPEQKQLKVAAATARMALKRAQKQLLANPNNSDLQAQIPPLEQALAEAEQAFEQATSQEGS
jgi:electron transport complex protein RnfC